jgi:hypothetical protein
MFDLLIHSDWSTDARKRWLASASRREGGWKIDAPKLVGSTEALIANVFAPSVGQRIFLGFDFPIGSIFLAH